MLDYVCEELVADILERLPVKSVVRFKSLSKSLFSRICSPDFIHRHTLRSLRSPHTDQRVIIGHVTINKKNFTRKILTFHSEDQLPSTTCGYKGLRTFELGDLCISSSCNGVMCLVGQDTNRTSISLWNPSIRRKLTLPDHPSLNEPYRYECGIGFDPITGDYKIVIIPQVVEVGRDALVYTLKTGSWCKIDSPVSLYSSAWSHGYFVNGTLHWLVTKCDERRKSHCWILTFNLSTQIFGTIPLPEHHCPRKPTIIKGSLALATTNHIDNSISIWVMKDYNNAASWYEASILDNHDRKESIRSVFQLTNGDFVFMTYRGNIEIYNLSRHVRRLAKMMYVPNQFCIETYVDSLALLDRGIPF